MTVCLRVCASVPVCLCAGLPGYRAQLTLNGDPVYLSPLHFLCVNFGVPKLEPLERPAPPDDTIDPEDEALFIAAPHLFVATAQSRLGTAATTAGTPGGDGASGGGAGGGDNDSSSHSTPSHGRLGVDTAGVTSPIAVSPKPPGLSATGVLSATGGSVPGTPFNGGSGATTGANTPTPAAARSAKKNAKKDAAMLMVALAAAKQAAAEKAAAAAADLAWQLEEEKRQLDHAAAYYDSVAKVTSGECNEDSRDSDDCGEECRPLDRASCCELHANVSGVGFSCEVWLLWLGVQLLIEGKAWVRAEEDRRDQLLAALQLELSTNKAKALAKCAAQLRTQQLRRDADDARRASLRQQEAEDAKNNQAARVQVRSRCCCCCGGGGGGGFCCCCRCRCCCSC